LYQPHHRKVNEWIHRHTAWKSFIHSCGAVEPLIGEFIASGFDILNPVQCSACGMEPAKLKQRYGDRLVFWGGGVDTQKTLPFGNRDEVAAQVAERVRIFGAGGGYVFNPIHNIQARTPVGNVVTMFRTARETRLG
jgi:uroporphyrinogen-III decarboxylase